MKVGAFLALLCGFLAHGTVADLTDRQVMQAYCETMAGSDYYQQYRLDSKCYTRVQIFDRKVRFVYTRAGLGNVWPAGHMRLAKHINVARELQLKFYK